MEVRVLHAQRLVDLDEHGARRRFERTGFSILPIWYKADDLQLRPADRNMLTTGRRWCKISGGKFRNSEAVHAKKSTTI
ncbi:hypothetical protein RvY_09669 [Ramazzottius varieornatus]|uniref:Uncharacterized protein n=1 Tax=Ramazzottius varieornatus TaxID=947166 RepID=A0A1D1VFJ2_RAMVA|nr:hypothetical protein RvY_09669 [Ramazzottius varieornatus]